jgi:apolipoprotein N-acyltransferase
MKLKVPHKATWWAILSGLAYVLCFPRFDLPLLSVLFLPCLIYCVQNLKNRRQAWLLGFLLSFMVAVGGFHWIVYVSMNFGQMPLPLALALLLLFSLIAAPQILAFTVIGYHARFRVERLPLSLRPLFWATLYVGLEYLAHFLKIFPEHLGNTFIAYPALAQSASLGGVALLGFLVLWPSASLAYMRTAGMRAWPSLAISAGLLVGLYAWGGKSLERLAARPTETLKVGFIQPNIDDIEKLALTSGSLQVVEQVIHHLIEKTVELASGPVKPDLIIWPETAYPIVFPALGPVNGFLANGYANLVREAVIKTGVPLLFGGYETEGDHDFNSAILLSAKGSTEAVYRKNVLLVFGEYFPLDTWFPSLKKLNPIMGNFGRGAGPEPLPFNFKGELLPLGVNICYEAILPGYMRGYARREARLFVNITKDSWFGDTFEPWQHLQLSALRSVEHGIPMVRSTNTGLSGVVLPTGKTEILSPPFHEVEKVVEVPVPLEPKPTFYTNWGDWFAWLALGIAASLGALPALNERRRA